jgi:allophanate hydrolase
MRLLEISSLGAAYRAGTCTPHDIIDLVVARMRQSASNPVWISRFDADDLHDRARQLAGVPPASLPLYGIPFAVKDNIDVAGLPTTAACPDFAYTPAASATVVQRLVDAGAIVLGKTNLDQFATGLVGTRSPYGICRNAFDPDYISGGSSSGSAVAVALGMASFALGTDTAGSGRVPAAFNNLVGYKPTLGTLSTRGMLPACRSLDAISIFALTAADAHRVAGIAGGVDAADPWSRPFSPTPGRYWSQRGARVAVPLTHQLEFFGNADYARLFGAAIERAVQAGCSVHEVDIEPLLLTARLLYEGPWVAERYLATRALIESRPEAMHAVTRSIIEAGRKASALDAFSAQYRLAELRAAARTLWQDADALLLPTAGTHYRIDEEQADPLRLNSNLGRYTNFVNLMDLAAVAVPAGFTAAGLPFGVTLVGRAWEDEDLLCLGERLHMLSGAPLGATGHGLPEASRIPAALEGCIDVSVCGAHMRGLPLNGQLTSRGAWLVDSARTASCYRLFALPGGPPARPGLVRDVTGGAIEMEIWRMPQEHFGSFVQGIPSPLGIGRVRTESGREVPGFLCESAGIEGAEDITRFGGWRAYLARQG